MTNQDITIYAIPWFFLTMFLEVMAFRRRRKKGKTDLHGYMGKDSACSLAMGVGSIFAGLAFKFMSFGLLLWAYQYRIFDIPNVWWAWVLLIVAEDHCYYWFHRVSHEVRFFWAAHVNHHSSRFYNLSTALRQSWTTAITGPIFWVPLALIGFRPDMVVLAQVVSLLYQYWIHTELIGRLGPLEWIFNTPSHHRVHHGRNPQYLDKNYGGIFIVYDRLYGSFEPEGEAVEFGLTKNLDTFNPIKVAFHEWVDMFRDAWNAPTLRGKIALMFRSPAWIAEHRDEAMAPRLPRAPQTAP